LALSREDRVFLLLFILFGLLNILVLWLSPFGVSPDEAHYVEWSRRLDLAYYSKGPFIAWAIAACRYFFGHSEVALRLPAVFCYSLFSLCFYLFVRKEYAPRTALLSWLMLRSMLIFAQSGFLMTTDAPALLFWMLALWSGYEAGVKDNKKHWLLFGVSAAIGVLGKYTVALIYPAVVIFLFLSPKRSRVLLSPHFGAGALLFFLCISPIIIWNSNHAWVNFAHNSGHLLHDEGVYLTPRYFFELLGGQLALAGPLILLGSIWAVYASFCWDRGSPKLLYFAASAAPVLVLVVLVSLTKRVYANWPLPFYVGGLLCLTHYYDSAGVRGERLRRLYIPALCSSLVFTFLAHLVFLGFSWGVPGKYLPTKKLVGWSELAQIVQEELNSWKKSEGAEPFLLAGHYGVASAISFYAQGRPYVRCAFLGQRRMNQYDIWDTEERWHELRGRDALIVLKSADEIESLKPHFKEVKPLLLQPHPVFELSGSTIQRFFIFRGYSYDGFAPPRPKRR
jgi:undecaprenyl-diphosphatase